MENYFSNDTDIDELFESLSKRTDDVQWYLDNRTDIDFHDGVGGAEYRAGGGVLTSISVGPNTTSVKTVAVEKCVDKMLALLYYRYNGKLKSFRLKNKNAPDGKCFRTAGWGIKYGKGLSDDGAPILIAEPLEMLKDE